MPIERLQKLPVNVRDSGPAPDRADVITGGFIGAGLLLIAFNLRTGVASVGPVLSLIESGLGVSPATASLLTTIPVFAFGVFAFLTPSLSRRVGLHRLLGITMAAVAAGIGMRLIPSPITLFSGTVLLGAAIAIGNVCMPAAIKHSFASRVGLMMGLYSTALFLGAAAASAFTVPLASAFGGSWRAALAFWLVPAVVALLVWLPHSLRNTGHIRETKGVADGTEKLQTEPRLARLFRDRVAWSVTGYMGLQSLSYYAALTWIPTLLQDHGASAHVAGLMLSYSSFPAIAAALSAPILMRKSRRTWFPVAVTAALGAAGLTGLLVAPTGAAPWIWMTLLGLGQGGTIALSLSYIVLRSPDAQHTGHLSTMAQGVGYVVAGFGPLGLGLLHSTTDGWTMPLLALLLVLVLQFAFGASASRERYVLSNRPSRARRDEVRPGS
ncbi:cyanate permease [Frondihabitans sp. PAMC 28766]|uniref:CynX/NimT family MFS transporter n=1 Tax=Frondihabitans sp. PAMC 28766 TaxID=1795630 RepID=UPI00078E21DE|nr:MFS transporter [Frondihabitans sp. PAMC 28766]AMM19460.1 cyanate permease [Frondihabitans sp. PAMC 28766]